MTDAQVVTFLKRDSAILDYVIDWSPWLATDSDTIATSTWTVASGITKVSDTIFATNTKTRIWLSGGTAGEEYLLTDTITTDMGRTDERTIQIKVVA